MWIPRWLGEAYSKLFIHFGRELFTFQQARELLSADKNKLAVAFSKLHTKRALLIFGSGKPRLYTLLDPENFILLASEDVKNLDRIPQERYLRLVCSCFRRASETFHVKSFAVYGSVARGSAADNSDVDILLISDDFLGSVGSRIEKLFEVEDALQDELSWLRRCNIYTRLSFYPLKKEEAQRLPHIFLDLTEEAVILRDENRFLEKILLDLKAKLLEKSARRVFFDRDRWYWDLKPGYKFGDTVAVA